MMTMFLVSVAISILFVLVSVGTPPVTTVKYWYAVREQGVQTKYRKAALVRSLIEKVSIQRHHKSNFTVNVPAQCLSEAVDKARLRLDV